MKSNSTFSSAMANAQNYNNWVLKEFRPYIGQRILEVGFGHGCFYPLLPSNVTYAGVDIDPELVNQAKEYYPHINYYVSDVSSPDFLQDIGTDRYDTVLCVNVLEHIEYHQNAINNLLSVLTSGGRLILFVPAFNSLFTDLDKKAGHYRRYIKSDVIELLDLANKNSRIVKCDYFNSIGAIGWWVNKFYTHHSLESTNVRAQVFIFDKFMLPLSKLANSATKHFFGQSLITICEVI